MVSVTLKEEAANMPNSQKMSDIRTIACGVPQGTNLGSLLFLLYTNDLPNCLENKKRHNVCG
jgi:hypothetical protein